MRPSPVMLSLFAGFAQISARDIPAGIMPNKRQVVGTGVTTSTTAPTTSSTQEPPTTTSSSLQSSSTAPTTEPTTEPTTTPTDTPTTSSAPPDTSSPPSDTPSSSDSVPPSETSSVPSSTTVRTTIPITTTDASGNTITSSLVTRTAAPRTTSSGIVRTQSGSSSDLVVVGSSTINRSTLSSATTITSALVGEVTQQYVTTTYWTSDGTVGSSVYTTNRVVSSTTGFATATIEPSLANGGSGGSGGHLSNQTKAIIGGVVGGIGGAILIGGIAIVAWRLWGKKKREQLAQDDYMDSTSDSINREKRGPLGQPHQPTSFESYSNPNGPVNTASNF